LVRPVEKHVTNKLIELPGGTAGRNHSASRWRCVTIAQCILPRDHPVDAPTDCRVETVGAGNFGTTDVSDNREKRISTYVTFFDLIVIFSDGSRNTESVCGFDLSCEIPRQGIRGTGSAGNDGIENEILVTSGNVWLCRVRHGCCLKGILPGRG